MARARWWILVPIIGIMVGVVVWQHAQRTMGAYTTFTSQHLKVRFDYPAGWRVREMPKAVGRLTGEVQVFGPRREDLKYSPYVDVAAEAGAGGSATTLEEAVKGALTRRRQQRSYTVVEEKPARCAGQPASRILARYELTLPLEAVNRKTVIFYELAAYCMRDGQLFRLTFAAPEDEFKEHQHAFDRLVKTFAFLP